MPIPKIRIPKIGLPPFAVEFHAPIPKKMSSGRFWESEFSDPPDGNSSAQPVSNLLGYSGRLGRSLSRVTQAHYRRPATTFAR